MADAKAPENAAVIKEAVKRRKKEVYTLSLIHI